MKASFALAVASAAFVAAAPFTNQTNLAERQNVPVQLTLTLFNSDDCSGDNTNILYASPPQCFQLNNQGPAPSSVYVTDDNTGAAWNLDAFQSGDGSCSTLPTATGRTVTCLSPKTSTPSTGNPIGDGTIGSIEIYN